MKKFLSILLALAMVLALTACGEKAPVDGEGEDELDWPKKPITIICPYSAGGGSDLMARAVGEVLSERLGVAVVVEDKPGGSGSIGMSLLAASANDGYTIILTAAGACTLSPYTSEVPYSDKDFAPICQVSEAVTVLCVNKASGISTFEELVAMAKANPGSVTYGTSGAGGAHHVSISALGLAVDNNADLFKHVAYDGGAAAITALLGNHDTATASIYAEPGPYIESGEFIPLITLGTDTRPDYLPDTPTASELGYEGLPGGTWYAFAAPAGTDQDIIDLLEKEILDIMNTPEMQETFENLGNPVVLLNEEEITAKWQSAYASSGEVLKAIGMIS